MLKKCNSSLKIFFIQGVSRKSVIQTITLMMEWEVLFLEEIETGINEEWSKTKMKIKIPRIIEIMMKMKNKINKKRNV